MTAEQFVDAVWQLTDTAPSKIEAPIQRGSPQPRGQAVAGSAAPPELSAQFIWSYPEASAGVPQAGEQIALRRRFELDAVPLRAVALITCDNEYILYVNGRRLQADTDWPSIEAVPLGGALQQGANEIMIVARNAGSGPNAAALFFAARLLLPDGTQRAWGSDPSWQWTATIPDAAGRFAQEPQDWKPAAAVANQAFLGPDLATQLRQAFAQAFEASPRMVRASLVRCDLLMRSLGRPNREQVVTTRPAVLTTLEAIDLANGQIVADTLRRGAPGILARGANSPDDLIDNLYLAALCRTPVGAEREIARQLLGTPATPQGVEDLLWAVLMLPDFQLVR
jgi:hypothetical protein